MNFGRLDVPRLKPLSSAVSLFIYLFRERDLLNVLFTALSLFLQGKHWAVHGHTHQGSTVLVPEEALYLVECVSVKLCKQHGCHKRQQL